MKLSLLTPGLRSVGLRAAAIAFCWSLVTSAVLAEDGVVLQSIDALYNLRNQLQDTVMKSVKGVRDAMQEGPPPDNEGKPWELKDLQEIQQKNQKLYDNAKTLAENQQKLLEVDQKILKQLPPGDPQRQKIEDEMKKVANGLPETRKKEKEWGNSLATANDAVDNWKKKEDSMYVPPVRPNTKSKAPPVQTTENEPSGPSDPPGPTGPAGPVDPGPYTGGGGGPSGPVGPITTSGGNVDGWQAKEAQLENEARNLGKIREQAVIDYLNDPTPENKEKAAAIKQKLDGMVNKLNKVRGKVDGLTGGSRPPLKVRTAKQIKKKWKQGGTTAGGGEDHHHGPGGTDSSSSGSEGHHHAADGSDVPYKTVSGAGGGGGGKARSGRGAGKRRKAGVASSSSTGGHSHGAGGVDIPNKQVRRQGGGNRQGGANRQGQKRRMAAAQQTRQIQQPRGGGYNLATSQNQVQNPNQQRRKKRQRGY